MPRIVWPLHRGRPMVSVVLIADPTGQAMPRRLLADTGAGSVKVGFDLMLTERDCLDVGGQLAQPTVLGGAFVGSFPVYLVRVQLPALAFDRLLYAVGVNRLPPGFDGIASFQFLSRFTYGNFGDRRQFGLEA